VIIPLTSALSPLAPNASTDASTHVANQLAIDITLSLCIDCSSSVVKFLDSGDPEF
jgi:hypothetical protein